MSPEASALQNPDTLRHQLIFNNLLPAALVLEERQRVGTQSTWDKFMHDCFGHPTLPDYKEVRHPDQPENPRVFQHRLFDGYAPGEGVVMVMRAGTAAPSVPEDYLLFTADLYDEKITAWSVAEINIGHHGKEFVLSERADAPDRTSNLFAVPDSPIHPVRIVAEGIRQARITAVERARRPRLVWGPQIRAFQKPGGTLELMTGRVAYLYEAITAYQEAQHTYAREEAATKEAERAVGEAATIEAA